eukprot:8110646-Pyramimonas_sp.AAC.1
MVQRGLEMVRRGLGRVRCRRLRAGRDQPRRHPGAWGGLERVRRSLERVQRPTRSVEPTLAFEDALREWFI